MTCGSWPTPRQLDQRSSRKNQAGMLSRCKYLRFSNCPAASSCFTWFSQLFFSASKHNTEYESHICLAKQCVCIPENVGLLKMFNVFINYWPEPDKSTKERSGDWGLFTAALHHLSFELVNPSAAENIICCSFASGIFAYINHIMIFKCLNVWDNEVSDDATVIKQPCDK